MDSQGHEVFSTDGIKLFVRVFRPETSYPQELPTFFLIHGILEHGGRYLHVAHKLVQLGWRVIILDHRGHGYSGGTRFHVTSFSQYLQDLELVRQTWNLQPQRTVLFGHSMGALIAARYVQTVPQIASALIMSAPLLAMQIRVPVWKYLAGCLLYYVSPKFKFRSQIDTKNLTHDPEVIARRLQDPLIGRHVTVSWYFSMLRALQEVHRDAGLLNLPVMLLQGTGDVTVSPTAGKMWLQKVASTTKHYVDLPNQLHELLNEPEWETTLQMIIQWLNPHVPGLPHDTI